MIPRYTRKEMGELWSEELKFRAWLEVEIAVCEAWAEKGKIPNESLEIIKNKADFKIERIDELEKELRHDVIAFLTNIAEYVGPDSRFIHLGLTSNDVVDTAQGIRLKRSAEIILANIDKLMESLKEKALKYKNTLQIGRTHGIQAEPTTFGLKCLLWWKEMERNRARLEKAKDIIAVGKISGAVGTFAHTGLELEEVVCKKLGLTPAPISTQVIQRDRHAEYLSALAILGGTLEKIALEVRNCQRTETGELCEPFGSGQKGSSAMPHKKNPVICENICGLARVMRGNALAGFENMALWHERDITHSSAERVILADTSIMADYLLYRTNWVIEGLMVREERMLKNIEDSGGLFYSQKIMLALVDKGLTREEAYGIVQRNALAAWEGKGIFKENLLSDPEFSNKLSTSELEELMDSSIYLKYVDKIFERCNI